MCVNISFENVECMGAIIVEGFDEDGYALKDVTLKNITIQRRESAPKQNVVLYCTQGLTMENIHCK